MERPIVRRPNRSWCAASLVCVGGLVVAAGAALALPTGFTDVQVQSPQVTDGEFFGRSVASLGTRLVVGAPGSSHPSFGMLPGRVYVLGLDGTAELVIENPTPASGDEFGASVAVASGHIAVGAPFDDTAAVDAGAAYVFDGTTGALLHTLLVPGSGSNYQCGRAIATLGSDVLVMCGGIYRFDGSTGALVQHYTATGCLGGRGLATIAGDVLSAGYDGTICRFDGATGAVVQTYVDPEPGLGGQFGGSIGVDGNVVVVGGEFFSGARESVYVFDGTTGALEQTIRGPAYGTPYNAGFGTSVAAAGGVLVGSGWNSARFYDSVPYDFLGEWQPRILAWTRRATPSPLSSARASRSGPTRSNRTSAAGRSRCSIPAGTACSAQPSSVTTATPPVATAARRPAGSSAVRRRSRWRVTRPLGGSFHRFDAEAQHGHVGR